MKPYVSLIIPFYNAVKFLPHCVECAQKQDYERFEVIMIDDGSTDDSYQLSLQLIHNDKRFHVLHQKNSGAAAARNTGLDNALGQTICFMDVDDEIDSTYISDLVQNTAEEVDLVIQGLTRISNGHTQDRGAQLDKTYHLSNPAEAETFFSEINIERFGGPYCKLYNSNILQKNHIRFNEAIRLAEDLDFLSRYLCVCKSVRVSSACHYRYLNNEGSASSHLYAFEVEYNGMCALIQTWNQLIEKFRVTELFTLREQSIAYYVYRCLFASSTLRELQSIPYCHIFEKYWSPSTPYLKIVKWLFVHRCFFSTLWLIQLATKKT